MLARATRRSRPMSQSVARPFIAPSAASSWAIWRPRSAKRRVQGPNASCRASSGAAGGDRLLETVGRTRPLDARTACRRDGQLADHEELLRETVRRCLTEPGKPERHDCDYNAKEPQTCFFSS